MIADNQIDALLNQPSYSKKYQITKRHHVIFWTIYILFNTIRWGSYFDDYSYSLKTNLLGFPIHMTLAYFNVYYLMPKFVYKKKILELRWTSGAVFIFNADFKILPHLLFGEHHQCMARRTRRTQWFKFQLRPSNDAGRILRSSLCHGH